MKNREFISYGFFLFIVLLSSCATIKKYEGIDQKKISDVKEIEGEYENGAAQNKNVSFRSIKSYIDFLDKVKDTAAVKSVKIAVLNDKKIQFIFKTENGTENKYETGYKLGKNGFIFLKNKNFRFTGLPYIFGGFTINKTEIGLTKQNHLILNGVKVDEGAILLILPASFPKINFTEQYNKK
ncbi:MAG: hypothetical protein CFE24_03150 [Flavobacterium sp. BFFFF2]|nr:MAG: hypothetical protein CFE24_03150 [Flavobacterium sp. BFFFF2]